MQTADSNENLQQRVSNAADADDTGLTTTTTTVKAASKYVADIEDDCINEQNENHLNVKYPSLSWRSNGLQRNKENSGSSEDGNWRSGSTVFTNNKDDDYDKQLQFANTMSVYGGLPDQDSYYDQDKKFNTRTFAKSTTGAVEMSNTTLGSSGNVGLLQVDKTMLRNRESVSGRNTQRQHNQQTSTNNEKSSSKVNPLLQFEDMRISKILRRLLSENGSTAAVELCKKLEKAVRSPENVPYICRSFEYLTESMLNVLKQCPVQCAEQASTVLGLIGYINRADFPIYKNYITKTYQTHKGIQKYLMMALKTTFSCDAVNLSLIVYSERVLMLLKDYLENADKAENFIAISETIAEFSKHYKRAFEKHFTDIVDIVVGWHLEIDQPHALKLHCATVLQQLSQYFLQELDFTFGLLGQFLEDIASFSEKGEVSIGSFIGAFNSILKTLANKNNFIAFSLGKTTLQQALTIITKATKQSLTISLCEETIINSNEFLCLVYAYSFEEIINSEIEEVIALQIQNFKQFDELQMSSLLFLIFNMLRRLRTNTPKSLVTLILKTEDNPIAELKMSQNNKNSRLLLKIYHEILMIKNVPLLQEAYRHIIKDINLCIASLECDAFSSKMSYTHAQSECILCFYFSALSALATQTSSIIGMYALNPSILEMLIVNCKAANLQLWSRHTALHSSLLQLLSVHCQRNHNYRISSSLLRKPIFANLTLDDSPSSSSPTSENFSIILKFLSEIYDEYIGNVEKLNLNILLDWTHTLLEECREHAEILENNSYFVQICKSVCVAALQSPLESVSCLEVLLKYTPINSKILLCLKETAIYHLTSTNPIIKKIYTIYFARLPLSISLDFNKYADIDQICQCKLKAQELEQWYISTVYSAPLRDKYFKPFLEHISIPQTKGGTLSEQKFEMKAVSEFVKPIFSRCWTAQQRESTVTYQKTALNNTILLTSWLQYEAARYCVRNKLRTTVGKPQETFLKIEAIIMQYARILAMKEGLNSEAAKLDNIVVVQQNARQLLSFLESLEKHIYNASEGTAFAIPALEKPAKTFFRVNAPTCKEWFKRIRCAVNLVAIHSMEPEMVVRYSEVILKSLYTADKYNELLMDHTIMSMVWALLRCGEADTLQGLYTWVKEKTGKRHLWIKYVAEQAAGYKEQAAEGYMHILNEQDVKMDAYIKEFLTDQLFDCLYYTNQWNKLCDLVKNTEGMKRETIMLSCVQNQTQLVALKSLYDSYANPKSQEVQNALYNLTNWNSIEEAQYDIDSKENFSYYKLIQKVESNLVANIVTNGNFSQTFPSGVQEALHSGLQECFQRSNCNNTPSYIAEHLTDFIILNHVAQKVHDSQFNDEEAFTADTFDCSQVVWQSTVRLKCLRWSRLCNQYHYRTSKFPHVSSYSMFLDIAASARREGNSVLCRTELEHFFAIKGFKESLVDISMMMQNQTLKLNVNDADLLRGFTELANYLHTNASNQMDAINLASAYCYQMIEQVSQKSHQEYSDTTSKMLLTLAEWLLQRGSSAATVVNTPHLQKLLTQLVDITVYHADECNSEIPPADMACGKLLQSSILQNGNSGQAWCAFGNWCYRWGKKIVEAKAEATSTQKAGLTQRDLDAIRELISNNENDGSVNIENALDGIVEVLNKHQVNANDGDEDIETSEISSTELIETQLRKIALLREKPAQNITSIIKIWRQAHKSVYTFYEMAAEAYFKYLCIETDNTRAQKRSNDFEDSSLVTTTLRLLRLVVKHAFGLQEVLEDGLSNTPTRPWNVIIPQLFSRLNHHEPYVRKRVSELLCRVAEDKPHLIIFPAVVGAQQELKKLQPVDKESPERETEEQKTPLSTCFNSLLSTLSNQASETVKQVQLLVKELRRVTLLWDEYWIHSLAQLYAEYSTLFNTFEAEVKKCTELQWDALRAKHAILMRHVSTDLRKIAAVTEREAETNYERNFQERYNQFVQNTINELEKPLNLNKPNESWIKIKQLYSVFQQRALRTSASTLKMYDISPILASMRNTAISMPGVETFDKKPIYIKAVDNTVHILPTKTKPKKLAFFGSDGRKYTYLFKGLEDLHLDERIMQFLSISNSMLARCSDTLNSSNCYKAHFYSVIPLGPQSGLISWVDNVTPLFAIYKKWQQREALVKQQQKERPTHATNNNLQISAQQNTSVPAAVRPSELFYSKLTPLLAEQNIKITDTRKHWPLSTLRRVLEELTKETPSDLLAKELWCHATNAAEWRRSIRNYSLSVAVMSVIGYVIGLGDRHLDNVLVKLSSGEIVHIDYNVCFEKGKTLRVPEKVPFRMTPNLEEALGITGIEGTFRLSCEHVLRTLRKERETLLTLLEAFVYDPLVDWAVSDDGTATSTRLTSALVAATDIAALKLTSTFGVTDASEDANKRKRHDDAGILQRKYDTDSSRNTISLRFNELKSFWMQYNDEAKSKLLEIVAQIEALQRNREDIRHVEQERDSLTKQLAMIRELETLGSAMGSHSLSTISQRYKAYKKAAEEFNRVKQGISKYHNDLKQSVKVYFEDLLIAHIPQSEIGQLRMQLYEHQNYVYKNEFDLVRALLEKSAQEVLYNKTDFARREMDNTLHQQACMSMECIESLTQYAKILCFYPRSLLLQNRLVKYTRWYGALLDEDCNDMDVKKELQLHVDEETNCSQIGESNALKYSSAMEKIWIEMNFELHKAANFLSEQKQQVVVAPVDITLSAIVSFIAIDTDLNTHSLQLAMLETISKTNESFIIFEETSLNKDDDDIFILDQQIDYIDMLLTMYSTVFQDSAQQSYAALQTLSASLQALYKLKTACHISYSERIIHFFMLDDQQDLQNNLQLVCACNGNQDSYARFRERIHNDQLVDFLKEVEELFDECSLSLKTLQTLVVDLLKQLQDECRIKNFVQSNLCKDFDPDNKKYETIVQIFQNAQSYAESLQTNNLELFYDARLLNQPVTKYINYVQNHFVTGLTSLLAYILHQNLQLEVEVASSSYQNIDEVCLLNAKALCQNLFVSLQSNCRLKHLQMQVNDQTKLVEHYTLVATAHFWANERYFRDSQLIYGHIVHKEKLLHNIQNECQSLSVWKLTMVKIQTEIEENVNDIGQRLKWAVGANQNLYALQEAFNNCVMEQKKRYSFFLKLATQLVEYGNVLLQFELLQHCPNNTGGGAKESVVEADRAFKIAVTKWHDALNNLRHIGSIITPVEQSIVQLLDPENKVDKCWINNISGLLDEMTFAAQRQLADYDRAANKIQENIYEYGQMLQSLMDNQLRMDIRHLLKSIAKVDAFSNQTSSEKNNAIISARIREFQHSHKQFYAQLNDLQMKIISRDYAENVLKQLNEQITNILQTMADIYMDFIDLVQSFIQNDFSSGSPVRSVRSAAAAESQSNYNMAVEKKAINQREQKRNAYAVSVWKRIRMKLEGRDPDPNRRSTVTEQVDFIIREATNPDNLAVLYEGWTPWV